ncbi:MAG: hypothetical protein JW722_07460 [Demequinaceae bacterium]|nr:hypothetical protein [Demequinaceae bacterium]
MKTTRITSCITLVLLTGTTSACSASDSGAPAGHPLTIAELMGQDWNFSSDDFRDNDRRIQELIADCMSEQGWEYIPAIPPSDYYEPQAEDEFERRQREGYGIAYWTLNRNDDIPWIDPNGGWTDPNAAYVMSLTESELEAYNYALYGDGWLFYDDVTTLIEPDVIDPDVIIDPIIGPVEPTEPGEINSGCYGQATDEVYSDPYSDNEEYWEAMDRFYTDLEQRVSADPRFTKLEADWSSCMKDAGLDYAAPEDVWGGLYNEFLTRHDDIVGDTFNRDPFEGWTQDQIDDFYATATQEQIDALYENLYALTDDQRAALEILLADEIEVAVAEYGCTKTYNEDYQDIYSAIEEAYALEHQAEIEALMASFG